MVALLGSVWLKNNTHIQIYSIVVKKSFLNQETTPFNTEWRVQQHTEVQGLSSHRFVWVHVSFFHVPWNHCNIKKYGLLVKKCRPVSVSWSCWHLCVHLYIHVSLTDCQSCELKDKLCVQREGRIYCKCKPGDTECKTGMWLVHGVLLFNAIPLFVFFEVV